MDLSCVKTALKTNSKTINNLNSMQFPKNHNVMVSSRYSAQQYIITAHSILKQNFRIKLIYREFKIFNRKSNGAFYFWKPIKWFLFA